MCHKTPPPIYQGSTGSHVDPNSPAASRLDISVQRSKMGDMNTSLILWQEMERQKAAKAYFGAEGEGLADICRKMHGI